MSRKSILTSLVLLVIYGANNRAYGTLIENSDMVNASVYRSITQGSIIRESTLRLSQWIDSVGYHIISINTIVKGSSITFSYLSLDDHPGMELLKPEEAFGSEARFPFNRVEDSHITATAVGKSRYGLSCGKVSDNSTSLRSWLMGSSLQGSLAKDSNLDGAFVCGSQITFSSLFKSNATRSTLTHSLVVGQCVVTDSQIENSVVENSVLNGCVIKHSKVVGKTFNNITMINNVIQESK